MSSNNQMDDQANFENNIDNNFGIIFENIDRIFFENIGNRQNTFENILENNFNNIFLSMLMPSIFDYDALYEEQLESVIEESFENQPTLEKTDNLINIPSQKFDSLEEKIKNDNKECTICLTEFEKDDDISLTKCNHVFHNDCIIEWGKYKVTEESKSECPICRTQI